MTEQTLTAAAYIKQVKMLDLKIDDLVFEIAKADSNRVRITQQLDGVGGGSSAHDKIGDAMIALDDRKERLATFIDYYNDKRDRILSTVEEINNPQYVRILHMRYFEGKRWEDIAYETHYTYQHTHRIHAQAISALQGVLDKK